MNRFASIVSTGMYLPEIKVSNDVLRQRFAHLPDFIDKMEDSSGIRCRWHAPEDWATSDLALPAAKQALERAGLKPEDVDLIILGTDSPDYITPATSVVLQYKLGAVNAGTFDVGCACASFPTALASGAGWIATNPNIKVVLVVGVYLMHKLAQIDDPDISLDALCDIVPGPDFPTRGQIIGYSGQTGDVNSPQLHFEIRQATTPVNPRSNLSNTTASAGY